MKKTSKIPFIIVFSLFLIQTISSVSAVNEVETELGTRLVRVNDEKIIDLIDISIENIADNLECKNNDNNYFPKNEFSNIEINEYTENGNYSTIHFTAELSIEYVEGLYLDENTVSSQINPTKISNPSNTDMEIYTKILIGTGTERATSKTTFELKTTNTDDYIFLPSTRINIECTQEKVSEIKHQVIGDVTVYIDMRITVDSRETEKKPISFPLLIGGLLGSMGIIAFFMVQKMRN